MSNQQNSNTNEGENPNMNENNKYLYEKAIEGRQFHMECFNHWMNMYAIFNGALLVAFTAISKSCNEFLILLITLLGIITSALWCFSVNGYYDWIISWINVVSFYESKLKNGNESVYIYRLFSKSEKENNFPFSTQKCTQFFTKCVCGAWVVLLIYQVLLIFSTIKDWVQQYWWIIGTVLLIFILILLAIGFFSKLRENLTETHKNLTKIRTSNSRTLKSELQGIYDFEE